MDPTKLEELYALLAMDPDLPLRPENAEYPPAPRKRARERGVAAGAVAADSDSDADADADAEPETAEVAEPAEPAAPAGVDALIAPSLRRAVKRARPTRAAAYGAAPASPDSPPPADAEAGIAGAAIAAPAAKVWTRLELQQQFAAADAAARPALTLRRARAVGFWRYGAHGDLCIICRNKLTELCTGCQGEDFDIADPAVRRCVLAWGRCSHVFHEHCLADWLPQRSVCPLDNSDWNTVYREFAVYNEGSAAPAAAAPDDIPGGAPGDTAVAAVDAVTARERFFGVAAQAPPADLEDSLGLMLDIDSMEEVKNVAFDSSWA